MRTPKIKVKIIEKFGNQWRFADEIGEHESKVSMVIHGRRKLNLDQKRIWAAALKCQVEDIFE